MDKIAFIDLWFHKKTKSSIFFQDILKKYFDISVFYEDSVFYLNETKKYINWNYDKYVFWQVIPNFLDLIKIKDKEIILIPMYDGLPLYKISWERYKCFKIKIICFCRKVYDFFNDMWFECFYLQYYLPPLKYDVDYSNKKIFFWYRWNITWENVKTIIWNQNVSITIKNNPDPWHNVLKLSEDDIKKYNVVFLNKFFDTKEEYFEHMAKHSIFIAPRKQEWIWMSFLEGMSMWQCIIAYNDATMDEYIVDNENGILTKFDWEIILDKYAEMWKNAKLKYESWFTEWNNKIESCIIFINSSYNKICKKITLYDYIIDILVRTMRFIYFSIAFIKNLYHIRISK